jgi:LPXTG-motif cell wall-anchored protein
MQTFARRKTRILLSTLLSLSLLLAFAPATVSAVATQITGEWEWYEVSATTIAIAGHIGASGNLTIPSTLEVASGDTRTIVKIGTEAFFDDTTMTGVTIPSTVTEIRADAFRGTTGVVTLVIPDSVLTLGAGAFSYMTGLTSVTLPSGLVTIPDNLFFSDTLLDGVKLPDSVSSIGAGAFQYNYALSSIRIPYGVTTIGNYAFKYATDLVRVDLPSGLTSIGEQVFAYDSELLSIVLPDGLATIGGAAFMYTGLIDVVLPQSLDSIGDMAFKHTTSLASATVLNPDMVFGAQAFDDTALGTDGIYGWGESTAALYATLHDPVIPFTQLSEYPPVLGTPNTWQTFYGETLASGQILNLSGMVSTSNDSMGSVSIFARVQGVGSAELVDTVSLHSSEPAGFSQLLGVPPMYEADWSGTFTLPEGLSAGEHYLVVYAVQTADIPSIQHVVFFKVAAAPSVTPSVTPSLSPSPEPTVDLGDGGNPQTGDATPLTALLVAGGLAAALLLLLKRRTVKNEN